MFTGSWPFRELCNSCPLRVLAASGRQRRCAGRIYAKFIQRRNIRVLSTFVTGIAMRVSAKITPNDHQEFHRALASGGIRLALQLKSAQLIAVVIFLLTSLALFAITLAQATHEGGLAIFLDKPVVLSLAVVGLLCVPGAAALLWGTAPILRALRSASSGKIDTASMREGITLGEARYEIGDEGLRVDVDLIQQRYSWRVFSELRETDNLFCLMTGKGRGIVVPKRAFDGEAALDSFRSLFTAQTEAAV